MQPLPPHLSSAAVAVSRNGDGQNAFPVPLAAVTGACIAVARGGDFHLLPEPALAVYAPAELVPAELRTGQGHVGGNALLIVECGLTDSGVRAWLSIEGEKHRHTVDHVNAKRRRRRRSANRPGALTQ